MTSYKKLIHISSFAVTLSIGFAGYNVSHSTAKDLHSIDFVRYNHEDNHDRLYQKGRDDIAIGKALINEGEADKALGHYKRGQGKINEGRALIERGRERVEDSKDNHSHRDDNWGPRERYLNRW